ncbi:MAG: hypothetical protein AVDCRST_MAG52-1450, partial [uncultured Blastococcus sp.]
AAPPRATRVAAAGRARRAGTCRPPAGRLRRGGRPVRHRRGRGAGRARPVDDGDGPAVPGGALV